MRINDIFIFYSNHEHPASQAPVYGLSLANGSHSNALLEVAGEYNVASNLQMVLCAAMSLTNPSFVIVG
jgi:hypothetical protein